MSIILGIDPAYSGLREIYINQKGGNFKISLESKPDKIILDIPAQYLTFRKIKLPFTDRKKIKEIINEELAQNLLFYEDSLWDFTYTKDGEIFAAIAKKSIVEKILKSIPQKINYIEAEPFSLIRIANHLGHKNALLIDFGASKTTFIGINSGKIEFCKVILKGGNDLNNYLVKKLEIKFEEAENFKKNQNAYYPIIADFLGELLNLFFIDKINYPYILISGGGGKLKNLDNFLKNKFNLEVRKLNFPEDDTKTIALGNALKNINPDNGVNFKKEEPSKKIFTGNWIYYLLIPLLLFSLDIKFKENYYRNKYRTLEKEMKNIAQSEFSLKYVNSPYLQVKNLVLEERKIFKFNTPLNILTEISKSSKDLGIKFYEINYTLLETHLVGEAPSIKAVEKFKESLKNSRLEAAFKEAKNTQEGKINIILVIQNPKN